MTEQERHLVGIRLAEVRVQRSLTIQMLSARTEIHINTLRAIEQGKHQPSLDTVISLVRALDVSMDYLVLGVRPQTSGWGLVLRSEDESEADIVSEADEP